MGDVTTPMLSSSFSPANTLLPDFFSPQRLKTHVHPYFSYIPATWLTLFENIRWWPISSMAFSGSKPLFPREGRAPAGEDAALSELGRAGWRRGGDKGELP